MVGVTGPDGALQGIITDGDLRRALDHDVDFHDAPIGQHMTTRCKTVTREILAAAALHTMEERKISSLVIVDDANRPTGLIHLHDLLRAGIA